MTAKRVSFGAKPTSKPAQAPADSWVENRTTGEAKEDTVEPMKRLTIDIPASLHRAIKAQCAMRGTKIADELREILSQKYGKN